MYDYHICERRLPSTSANGRQHGRRLFLSLASLRTLYPSELGQAIPSAIGRYKTALTIELDTETIKKYIKKKIDEQVNESLFLVDVETMCKKCSMSRRHMEEEFLSDPRFKQIEKRKVRKRFYYWEEAKKVIEEIIDEW